MRRCWSHTRTLFVEAVACVALVGFGAIGPAVGIATAGTDPAERAAVLRAVAQVAGVRHARRR